MKTLELTGDSEELILEKFTDGSVELSIEYETPSWGSSGSAGFCYSIIYSSKRTSRFSN